MPTTAYVTLELVEVEVALNLANSPFQTSVNTNVTSWNGRTGDVVPIADDYSASEVINDSTVTGAYVDDALTWLNANKIGGYTNLTTQYRMVYVSAAGTLDEMTTFVTDVNGDLALSGTLTVDHIQWDLVPAAQAAAEGLMQWDVDAQTLTVGMFGGEVNLQVGQEGLIFVRNISGVSIGNGKVVYATGAQGNRLTVALADYQNANTICILGFATETIANNADGWVALWGVVHGTPTQPINTGSFVAGDRLFLNSAGGWTKTHPPLPTDATVLVGIVQRVHASLGEICIRIIPFTMACNFNGTVRKIVNNTSTGVSAGTGFTAINNASRYATFGIGGSNNTTFPNVTVFYGSGYNDNWYAVDGNKSHKWFVDPLDGHNNGSLNYLSMELSAAGLLTVPRGGVTATGRITATDGTDLIRMYVTNDEAYLEWNDGNLTLITLESNTDSIVYVMGNGTLGHGEIRITDQEAFEWLRLWADTDAGYIEMAGASPGVLHLNYNASANVALFANAASSETKEVLIYGNRSGTLRSLQIGCDVDAENTASFDGLTYYLFDGTLQATTLTVSGNYTFPTADGALLQTQVTNGAGTLSWAGPYSLVFNGLANPDNYTLSYNATNRQFTVVNTTTVAAEGVSATPSNETTAAHADVTGQYWAIYQSGDTTLTITQTPDLITDAIVGRIYYNTDQGAAKALEFNEKHSQQLSEKFHENQHETVGAKLRTSPLGCAMADYTLQPAGPANADNQFSLAAGEIYDEDIEHTIDALVSGGYSIIWRAGTDGSERWDWLDTFTVPVHQGGSYMYWNELTGGSWQLTAGTNGQYINMFVFAWTRVTAGYDSVLMMGQAVHASVEAAQTEEPGDLQLPSGLAPEQVPLYRLTFRLGSAYTTTGKCRIEAVTDFRGVLTGATVVSGSTVDHQTLTNRDAVGSHPATAISVDATGFSGVLSATDTDVQTALDTIDAGAQPLDADLTTIAGLTVAQGKFIVGSASPAWSISAYTVPIADGTDGLALITDGAGAVTFGYPRAEVNAQTGTSYTFVLGDQQKIVTCTNAAAIAVLIPTNASVAFDVNTTITVLQGGAGVVTITGDTGVTVNGVSAGGAAINAQYSGVTLLKTASDTWIMFGDHGLVS